MCWKSGWPGWPEVRAQGHPAPERSGAQCPAKPVAPKSARRLPGRGCPIPIDATTRRSLIWGRVKERALKQISGPVWRAEVHAGAALPRHEALRYACCIRVHHPTPPQPLPDICKMKVAEIGRSVKIFPHWGGGTARFRVDRPIVHAAVDKSLIETAVLGGHPAIGSESVSARRSLTRGDLPCGHRSRWPLAQRFGAAALAAGPRQGRGRFGACGDHGLQPAAFLLHRPVPLPVRVCAQCFVKPDFM